MTINFNVSPYYDDYDEDKGYHRILFKPSVAVQARELTQLQTILQNQLERFGGSIFKEGAMVIPGQAAVDTTVSAVKLATTTLNLPTIFESGNVVVTGATTGLQARVIKGIAAEGSDPATLIIKFIDSGTNNETTQFNTSETLTISGSASTLTTAASSAVTNSSVAFIGEGIYFVLGNFVKVNASTIVLNKYNNTPTYRIGLAVSEDFITEADDSTLNDNAIGSYNESAPGAHRYKISLALDKLDISSTLDQDFIELIRIENGIVKQIVNKTEYSQLERTLARRTYDESGDYTVSPFRIQIREHRDNNRGTWSAGKQILVGDVTTYSGNIYVAGTAGVTGNTAPTWNVGSGSDGNITWVYTETPSYNQGVYTPENAGDESKLAIGIEPGKAYVRGYEIEKIATEYLTIPKARDSVSLSSQIIRTSVGNYVELSNVFCNNSSTFDVTSFTNVNLYDAFTVTRGAATANIVGTAKVRDLRYLSGNASLNSAVFGLSIFDVSMNANKTFERNVKQIALASGQFTSDINPTNIKLTGTINTSASTVISGSGTLFSSELIVGDWIYFDSPSAGRRKVTAINGDYSLNVDVAATITNSAFYLTQAEIKEPEDLPLLYSLPLPQIKETTGQQYTVTESITGTSTGAGVLTLGGSRTYNTSAEASDYVLINITTGATQSPTSITYPAGSTQVQFNGLSISNNYVVVTPVVKSLVAKTKTPTSKILNITDANTFSATEILLTEADVYKIDSIKMSGNTVSITDWFLLDNGQKSTHYDVSKIIRKPGYPAPVNNVTISFSYFEHGTGDYFSANSYSSIQYKDIPYFVGSGYGVKLSDVLDFRPRKDDTNLDFTSTGSSRGQLPRRGFQSTFGYSYYLPRKDKIALDFTGNLFAISGVSSLNPQDPNDPSAAMTLYKLNLQPYTISASEPDVTFEYIDNKRYTMRDIGKIENRLKNIEYYTALSLLEQETKSLSIIDSATGLDRYKNGFIVDNFESHGVGDIASQDYLCSIDMEENELRPLFNMENINLVEEQNSDAGRIGAKYQLTGDIITLRYSNTPLITQQYASRTENVNPFAVSTWNGSIEITPQSDEWFDVERLPDVVNPVWGGVRLNRFWNSWQNQWLGTETTQWGTPQSSATASGSGAVNISNNLNVSLQTLASSTNPITTTNNWSPTRLRVRSTAVNTVDTRTVNDRVVSSAAVPFIRSRIITFLGRTLKPSTKVLAYFDNTPISDYVTPATKVTVTSVNGLFDNKTNVENFDTLTARNPRRISGDPVSAFNRGDVVYVSNRGASSYVLATSPATAVVMLHERNGVANVLHVVNIQGNILASDTLTGTISGANGIVSSNITAAVAGNDLITNVGGDVAGYFNIPNTDAVRFRTGSREFKLADALQNSLTQATTIYEAAGIQETKQATINSVRRVIPTRPVTRNRKDPLAQTFFVDKTGGCFLTKVDIYFKTKSDNVPVICEIREVINGYPGPRTLPFASVILTPDKVNVSEDASVATTFTFESPVYVENGIEYCIVLLSDSVNYNVWISQLAERNIGTDRFISEQPYIGVLFKSQNASTWSPDQLQDLKFTLYRALFDTANNDATVSFVNEKLSKESLTSNPFKVKTNSNVVKVLHDNHGMNNGSNVTLSGFVATANIAASDINKSHIIGNVLLDSYTITVGNVATLSTFIGGENILATSDIPFDAIQPIVSTQTFADTSITFNVNTSSATQGSAISGTAISVTPNETNFFSTRQAVKAEENEIGGNKSFKLSAVMSTTNDSVSPVIDLSRVSLVAISNKIDNVNSTTSNFGHDDRVVVSANASISFNGNVISTTHPTIANLFATVDIGKSLVITGAGATTNNSTVLVSGVTNNSGSANITCVYSFTTESTGNLITLTVKDNFVNDIAPIGSTAAAKYITRQVNLQNPSEYLTIIFAASVPNEADIDVYYRTGTGSLTNTNWTLLSPTARITKTSNPDEYKEITYEKTGLAPFTTVAVKIVLKSTNTAAVPTVKDLRVIACA